MKKQDLTRLEGKVNELRESLAAVANNKDFAEFLRIIRRPGWTTPAELALVVSLVDGMQTQVKALAGLKAGLLSGASKVELNPQPLPP